ncbi:MAG: AsmA family protein [Marinicella sp.]
MKKLIKWLLGLLVFFVVLLVLAIILLPILFDPNDHKPQIQEIASKAIGREVALQGPIEWSVFPWIAINLNDVSIANANGFKGDHLAEVQDVSVRVKLLPLLKKEIKVGQIELQKPKINLQVAKSGQTNWQSVLDTLTATQAAEGQEASSTELEIKGIAVTDGQLTYTDAAADLQLELNALRFSSDAIRAGQPTQMSIDGNLSVQAMEITGDLAAGWQALTLAQAPKLIFKELSFKGQAGQVPLKLSSQGEAVLDTSLDVFDLAALQLEYGNMRLSTPVKGTQLSQQMALSGQLKLDPFSLADLLSEMGSSLDNQAGNQLSGDMQWSLIGNRLVLKEVNVKLDDSTMKGQVDIRNLSRLQGSFDFTMDQLNLDLYLPKGTEAPVSDAAVSGSASMDLGQMTGKIKLNQLQAAGVKMSDINLNIKTQGKNITVEPLLAGFYQGFIKTELKLQPDNTQGKLQVTHQMQDFQAGGLLTDLMGTDYLTGLGQLNADIKVDEPFNARPLKTANGSLSYRLSDGDIVGIDVYQILQQSLSLLNKSDTVKLNEELKTAFGLMEIQADVVDGVLKTNVLRLNSPYFDLTGKVEVDLDQQTIKGTIKPMLTNIPQGVLDQRFEKLLNLRIPVSLKGNLLEPDVSIDIEKLILESQKAKIDEKKEELKEDLFDAILGSKKDKKKANADSEAVDELPENQEMTEKEKKRAEKDQMKRDLLEGLFKSATDKDKKKQQEDQEDSGN